MAYRPPSLRNRENNPRCMECSICSTQYAISYLNIDKETYDRFTSDDKENWECESCVANQTRRRIYKSRASYFGTPGQRSTSQTKLDSPTTQDRENNMTLVRATQSKISDTESSILSEIRMLRGDIREINAKISSLSENMDRKFEEFERRVTAKDDEALILRHALIEHETKVNSTVQPIKYFLFMLVLLYLVTLLHGKRN